MPVYNGTTGNDTITASTGADTLNGLDGNDILSGLAAQDVLFGGNGNDTLSGGAGIDTLDGGANNDTADYSASTLGVTVAVNGSGLGGDAQGDTLIGIENLIGSALADILNGDSGANGLFGGNGNDTIQGLGGADTINGGGNFDIASYSLSGSGVTISLSGAAGTGGDAQGDTLTQVEGLLGSNHADSLTGDGVANSIGGGNGNDTILGGAGADTLDGGADNDTVSYAGSSAAVDIDLLAVTVAGGDAAGDVISGFENIIGSANGDTLVGNTGNNVITGGAGADVMEGGDGIDTVDYSTAGAAVEVDLDLGMGLAGDALLDSVLAFENITGSGFNDTLRGDGFANVLIGAAGSDLLDGVAGTDSLYGGSGADTLIGEEGADLLAGGDQSDTYVVGVTTVVVQESANEGTDLVQASVSYTLADNVENLTLTGGADLSATGNSLDNVITGNQGVGGALSENGNNALNGMGGNDTLIGNGGNDTLNGGTGNDSMSGGDGVDTYFVDATTDIVVELEDEGTDNVRSSVNWTLGAHVENLTLTGTDSINGTGNDLANTITGNTAANLLSGMDGDDALVGGDGNDTLNGGTGADSMTGGAGDDLYIIDNASDRAVEVSAGGTADRAESSISYNLATSVEILVLTGTDAINGGGNSSSNTLTGNSADNQLLDGFGNDTMFGGNGNDTLNGGTGTDSMVGGIGNDSYFVDRAVDVIVEGENEGTDLVQSLVNWTLGTNLENLTLIGSSGVTGAGNTVANVITGNARSNLLNGLESNDTINGADGADTLDGGTGADSMSGGADNDTYIVDNAGDLTVELEEGGIDTVRTDLTHTLSQFVENLTLTGLLAANGTGTAADNTLTGNNAENALSGLGGIDRLYGGAGADTLDGGTGADSMYGGTGADIYVVDDIADKTIETSTGGTDRVESSITHTIALYIENLTLTGTDAINGSGNSAANILTGNTAANLLAGNSGNDSIYGGDGNDTLNGGSGIDSHFGGIGNDTYIVNEIDDIVSENSESGTDVVESSVSWTLGGNLENLTLTGTSSLSGTGNGLGNLITGNSGSNLLSGRGGSDSLDGGDGNDTLDGGSGADLMAGGLGNDVYVVDNVGDGILELAEGGIDTVLSAGNIILGGEIENLTLTDGTSASGTGTAGVNVLTGSTGSNFLSGLGSNDTIYGGDGNDTLDGGTGIDSMVGGLGDDVFVVDDLADKVSELSGGGSDTVQTGITWTLGSNVENLLLTGGDAVNGSGNTLANAITGNTAANVLSGGSGNDTILGAGGNDTLDGGSASDSMGGGDGDDTYIVDAVTDFVFEDDDEGTDVVQSEASWTLGDNVENLMLTGSSGVSGTGNGLDNSITGNSRNNLMSGLDGEDVLNGAGGNDTLIGGADNDTLTGGTGGDTFVFNSLTGGNDTITDFNGLNGTTRVGDSLRFEGLLTGTFAYLGAGDFAAAGNSQARVDGANGTILVDTNGDGTSDITLALTGLTDATQILATDFVFV